MTILDARDILSFPGGDNSSDTLIGGIHFNLTTLDFWNYTLYSNGTLSNGSWCILTFDPYTPSLVFPNGSFVNVTSCYYPVYNIGVRAGIGIAFAALFGLSIVLTLVALSKHGKLYLPAEKRFHAIGRRWQWYWALFVAGASLVSLITNVDVDRYFLPEIPIVLNVFFWYLMQQGAMAVVWEAVRHWGSWMERQFIDPNPFSLRQDDKRATVEFWVPLFFYFWLWLNFFLIIPRGWGDIEMQRYPQQIVDIAQPSATDVRFKAAGFCMLVCWLTIMFSLRHSILHYHERNRGIMNRAIGLIRFTPPRFMLIVPLAAVIPAYQILCSWEFSWSPLNIKGDNLAIYLGGYAPSLLIVYIQIIAGFLNPNEDRELIRQRRIRGEATDRELGIVAKPAWWQRGNGDLGNEKMRDRIARNVRELGGGRATAEGIDKIIDTRAAELEAGPPPGEAVEMRSLHSRADSASTSASSTRPRPVSYTTKSDRRRSEITMQAATALLFPGAAPAQPTTTAEDLMLDGPPPYLDRGRRTSSPSRPGTGLRSTSTETSNSIASPPQQIKSMLDI